MTTGADIQAQEWEALYDELAATLERHGTQLDGEGLMPTEDDWAHPRPED
jgi:hypothetical protein